MKLYNRYHLTSRRRLLRHHLTPAEAALWSRLQHSQLHGRKFRRQHSIGLYIVDFSCPTEELVIELDGAAHDHEAAWRHDAARTRFLREQGLRLIRFENRDVLENLDGVLAYIAQQFRRG